ncbi:unnamed protein product, partial [Sphacelaria rigidula]
MSGCGEDREIVGGRPMSPKSAPERDRSSRRLQQTRSLTPTPRGPTSSSKPELPERPRQGEGMSLPRPRSVSPMGKSSLRTGSNGARWNSATTSSAAVPSTNVSTLSARIERTSFARASSAHANASPTPPPPKTRARFATQLDVDVTPTGRDSSFSGATTAVDEAEAEAELKFQPPRHPPPLSPSQAAAAAAA